MKEYYLLKAKKMGSPVYCLVSIKEFELTDTQLESHDIASYFEPVCQDAQVVTLISLEPTAKVKDINLPDFIGTN